MPSPGRQGSWREGAERGTARQPRGKRAPMKRRSVERRELVAKQEARGGGPQLPLDLLGWCLLSEAELAGAALGRLGWGSPEGGSVRRCSAPSLRGRLPYPQNCCPCLEFQVPRRFWFVSGYLSGKISDVLTGGGRSCQGLPS